MLHTNQICSEVRRYPRDEPPKRFLLHDELARPHDHLRSPLYSSSPPPDADAATDTFTRHETSGPIRVENEHGRPMRGSPASGQTTRILAMLPANSIRPGTKLA